MTANNLDLMLGLIDQKPVYDNRGNLLNPGYDQFNTNKDPFESELYNFQRVLQEYQGLDKYRHVGGGPFGADLTRQDRPESFYPYDKLGINFVADSPFNRDNLASAQGMGSEFVNGIKRIIPLFALDTISGFSAMADAIDFMDILDEGDTKFSDKVNRWAEGQRESLREWAPIYEPDNSGMGDSSWWFNNGGALVSSAASFLVQGGVIGKALTSVKWMNSLTKGLKAADRLTKSAKTLNQGISGASNAATGSAMIRAKSLQNLGNAFATSLLMTHAESAMSATGVYDNAYKEAIERGISEEAAKYIASEAASVVYVQNRYNVLLNMTGSLRFVKAFGQGKGLSSSLKKPTFAQGFWGEAYNKKGFWGKIGGSLMNNKKYDPVLRDMILEGTQEALEELVNLRSEQQGEHVANKLMQKDIDGAKIDFFSYANPAKILSNIVTKEGLESAVLGFLGGIGQLGLTRGVINNIPGLGGKVEKRDKFGNIAYKEGDATYQRDYEIDTPGDILSNDVKLADGTEYKKGDVVTKEMIDRADATGSKLINQEGTTVLEKEKTSGEIKPVRVLTQEPEYELDGKKMSINQALNTKFGHQQTILTHQEKLLSDVMKTVKDTNDTAQVLSAIDALENMHNPILSVEEKMILKEHLAKYRLKQQGKDYDTTVPDADAKKRAEDNVKSEIEKIEGWSQKDTVEAYQDVKQGLLSNQVRMAVENDFTESLKTIYKDIQNLDKEQAVEKGLDPDTYQEDAKSALKLIDVYSNIYNEYRYKYDSAVATKLYENRIRTESRYIQLENADKKTEELFDKVRQKQDLLDIDGELAEKRETFATERQAIIDEIEKLTKAQNELFTGTYKLEEGKTLDSTKRDVTLQKNILTSKLKELNQKEKDESNELLKDQSLLQDLEEARADSKDIASDIEYLDKRFAELRDAGKKRNAAQKAKDKDKEVKARSLLGLIDYYDTIEDIYKKSLARTHVAYFDLSDDPQVEGFIMSLLVSKYGKSIQDIVNDPASFGQFVNDNIEQIAVFLAYDKTDAEIKIITDNVKNSVNTRRHATVKQWLDNNFMGISETSIPVALEFVPLEEIVKSPTSFTYKGGYYRIIPLVPTTMFRTKEIAEKLAKLILPTNNPEFKKYKKPLFTIEKYPGYDDLYEIKLNINAAGDAISAVVEYALASHMRVLKHEDFDSVEKKLKAEMALSIIEKRAAKAKREHNKQLIESEQKLEERQKEVENLNKKIETLSNDIESASKSLEENLPLIKDLKGEDAKLLEVIKALQAMRKQTLNDKSLTEAQRSDAIAEIDNKIQEATDKRDKIIDEIVEKENKVKDFQKEISDLNNSLQETIKKHEDSLATLAEDTAVLTAEINDIKTELTNIDEIFKDLSNELNLNFSEVNAYYALRDKITKDLNELNKQNQALIDQAEIASTLLQKPKTVKTLEKRLSKLRGIQNNTELIEQILKEYKNLDDSDFELIKSILEDTNDKKEQLKQDIINQKNALATLKEMYHDIKEIAKKERQSVDDLRERQNRVINKAFSEQQDSDGKMSNEYAGDLPVELESFVEDYGSESYFQSDEYWRTTSMDVHSDRKPVDTKKGKWYFTTDFIGANGEILPNPSPQQRHNSKALNQLASGRLKQVGSPNTKLNPNNIVAKYVHAHHNLIANRDFYTDGNSLSKELTEAGIGVDNQLRPYVQDFDKFESYLKDLNKKLGNLAEGQQKSMDRLQALKQGDRFTIGLWDDMYRFEIMNNDSITSSRSRTKAKEKTLAGVNIRGRGLYTVLGRLKENGKFEMLEIDTTKGTFSDEQIKANNPSYPFGDHKPVILTLLSKNRVADNNANEMAAKVYSLLNGYDFAYSYKGLRDRMLATKPSKNEQKTYAELLETANEEKRFELLNSLMVSFGKDTKFSLFVLDNLRSHIDPDIDPFVESVKEQINEAFDFIIQKVKTVVEDEQKRALDITEQIDKKIAVYSTVKGVSDGFVRRKRGTKVDENGNPDPNGKFIKREMTALVGDNGALQSVDDITHFEVPTVSLTKGSPITGVGKNNDFKTVSRKLLAGRAYVRDNQGNIIPIYTKYITQEQADFVISLIKTEFELMNDGIFDPVNINTIINEDGKIIAENQNIPLLRFDKSNPNKGLNVISRVIHWTGIPKNKDKRRSNSLFFFANSADNGKVYLSYGSPENGAQISLHELFTKDAELDSFRNWLQQRPMNLSKEFIGLSNYHQPLKVEKRGDVWVMIAKEFKETQAGAKNAYLNYLASTESIVSDVISKEESEIEGLNGERTVGRYISLNPFEKANEATNRIELAKKGKSPEELAEEEAKKAKKTKAGKGSTKKTGGKSKTSTETEEGVPTTLYKKVKLIKDEKKRTIEVPVFTGELVKSGVNENKTNWFKFSDGTTFRDGEVGDYFAKEITPEEYRQSQAERTLDLENSTLKDIPFNTPILIKIQQAVYENGERISTVHYEYVLSKRHDKSHATFDPDFDTSIENSRFDISIDMESPLNQIYEVNNNGVETERRKGDRVKDFLTNMQASFGEDVSLAQLPYVRSFAKYLFQRNAHENVLPGENLIIDSPLASMDFLKPSSLTTEANNMKNIITNASEQREADVKQQSAKDNRKLFLIDKNFSIVVNPGRVLKEEVSADDSTSAATTAHSTLALVKEIEKIEKKYQEDTQEAISIRNSELEKLRLDREVGELENDGTRNPIFKISQEFYDNSRDVIIDIYRRKRAELTAEYTAQLAALQAPAANTAATETEYTKAVEQIEADRKVELEKAENYKQKNLQKNIDSNNKIITFSKYNERPPSNISLNDVEKWHKQQGHVPIVTSQKELSDAKKQSLDASEIQEYEERVETIHAKYDARLDALQAPAAAEINIINAEISKTENDIANLNKKESTAPDKRFVTKEDDIQYVSNPINFESIEFNGKIVPFVANTSLESVNAEGSYYAIFTLEDGSDKAYYTLIDPTEENSGTKNAFKNAKANLNASDLIVEGKNVDLAATDVYKHFVTQEEGELQKTDRGWVVTKKHKVIFASDKTAKITSQEERDLLAKLEELKLKKSEIEAQESKKQIPKTSKGKKESLVDYLNSLDMELDFKVNSSGTVTYDSKDHMTADNFVKAVLESLDDSSSKKTNEALKFFEKITEGVRSWKNIKVIFNTGIDAIASYHPNLGGTPVIIIGNGFLTTKENKADILLHEIVHHYTVQIISAYMADPNQFDKFPEVKVAIEKLKSYRDEILTEYLNSKSKDLLFKDLKVDVLVKYLFGKSVIEDTSLDEDIDIAAELKAYKKANKNKSVTAFDFYNHLNNKFTNEVQQKSVVQEEQAANKERQNILNINYTQQKTTIEIEIIGDTGKEFLLTRNRNSSEYSLWSEKQQDGSYKSSIKYPTKDEINNLVSKYIPESLQKAIDEWVKINISQDDPLNKSKEFEEKTLDPLINSTKSKEKLQLEVTTVKLNPAIESLKNDIKEFVSGIFENKTLQSIAAKSTVSNSDGSLSTLLDSIWNWIKDLIGSIVKGDIDKNTALFDSLKQVSTLISEGSKIINPNIDDIVKPSSYPQPDINYSVTSPRGIIYTADINSPSMFPGELQASSEPDKQQSTFDQLFNILLPETNVNHPDYIDRDQLLQVLLNEGSDIKLAKELVNRFFEEEATQALTPLIIKSLGFDVDSFMVLLDSNDIDTNFREGILQDIRNAGSFENAFHTLAKQYSEDQLPSYSFVNRFFTDFLSIGENNANFNLFGIIENIRRLVNQDASGAITQQLLDSVGRTFTLTDFDQQVKQLSEIIFEDGFTLNADETRSLFNGLNFELFNELITNQKDPDKLMTILDNKTELFDLYDKVFDEKIIPILEQKRDNLSRDYNSGELSDGEKSEYSRIIDRIDNILDSYLKDENHRNLIRNLHATTELQAFSIMVDFDDIDETVKSRDIDSYKESVKFNTKDLAAPIVRLMIAAIPKQKIALSSLRINPDQYIQQGYSIDNLDHYKFTSEDNKVISATEYYTSKVKELVNSLKDKNISMIDRSRITRQINLYNKYLSNNRILQLQSSKDDVFGFNELEDYDKVYNLIQKKLKNSKVDFNVVINRMQELADTQLGVNNGVFGLGSLVSSLRDLNNDSSKLSSMLIRNAFVQTFNKTEKRHYVFLFDEEGDIFPVEANSENIKSILINRWYRNLSNKLKTYNDSTNQEQLTDRLIFSNDYYEQMIAINNNQHSRYQNLNDYEKGKVITDMLGIEIGDYGKFVNIFENVTGEKYHTYVGKLLNWIKESDIIGTRSNIFSTSSPIRGRINKILEIAADSTITDVYENQYLNPNNDTVYTLSLYDFIADSVDRINSLADTEILEKYAPGLPLNEQKQKVIDIFLPHLKNVYTRNSKLMQMMLSDNNTSLLESSIISGIRINNLFEEGKETKDLGAPDLYAQRLNSVLSGIYNFTQNADRELFNALRINTFDQVAKTSDESVRTQLLYDTLEDGVKGFIGYLTDEFNLIIHHYLNPDNKVVYYNDTVDPDQSKAAKLRYFDNILSAPNKKKIEDLAKNQLVLVKDTKEFEDILNSIDNNLIKSIKQDIRNHFSRSVNHLKNNLKKNGVIDVKPFEEVKKNKSTIFEPRYKIASIDTEIEAINGYLGISDKIYDEFLTRYKGRIPNDKLQEFVLNKILETFIVNQEGMYIEQSKLFFGDPAFFKDEDDLFKRYKMYSSTKQISVNDNRLNEVLNENNIVKETDRITNVVTYLSPLDIDVNTLRDTANKKYEFGFGYRSDGKTYDGTIKTAIIHDIITYSSSAFLGENLDKIEVVKGVINYYSDTKTKMTNIPPLVRIFAESFVKDGIIDSKELTSKVKSYTKVYLGYEEGDGQGYITLDEYKELMIRNGLAWTTKHQNVFIKALRGEMLDAEEMTYFQPLKTQYTGPVLDYIIRDSQNNVNEETSLYVPTGYKHSLVPLIPAALKGTNLENILSYMRDNQIGILQFASGNKYGTKLNSNSRLNTLYDANGQIAPDWNTQTISYDYIGIQVNIQPKLKGYTPVGSQPRKLMLVNLFQNGVLKTEVAAHKNLITRYIDLQNEIVNRKFEQLKDDLGIEETVVNNKPVYKIKDIKRLVDILMQEAQQRGNPINVQRSILSLAVEFDRIQQGLKTRKGTYIEEILNSHKVESILNALFNSRIFKEKRPGEAFVQVSNIGSETNNRTTAKDSSGNLILKKGYNTFERSDVFLYYEEGIDVLTKEEFTVPAEMSIPLPEKWIPWVDRLGGLDSFNRKLESLMDVVHKIERPSFADKIGPDEDLTLSEDDVNLLKLITIVGFRIPNQGLNSTDAFRITKFLPTESGIAAIVPSEIVPKTGADFDVDKIQAYLSSYKLDKTGKPVYVNFVDDIDSLTDQEKFKLFKDRINEHYSKKDLNVTVFNNDLDDLYSLKDQRSDLTSKTKRLKNKVNDLLKHREAYLDTLFHEGHKIFKQLPRTVKESYWNLNKKANADDIRGIEKQNLMLEYTLRLIQAIENLAEKDNKLTSGDAIDSRYVIGFTEDVDSQFNAASTVKILDDMVINYTEWIAAFYGTDFNNVENHVKDLKELIKGEYGSDIELFKDINKISESTIASYNADVLNIDSKINQLNIKFYEILATFKRSIPFNTFEQFKNNFNNSPVEFNTTDALYNNIKEVQNYILRLPYNLRQLVAPVSDDALRGEVNGVVWDIRFMEAWDENGNNYFESGSDILKKFKAAVVDVTDNNTYNNLYNKYREEFINIWNKDFIGNKSLTKVISHENNVNKAKAYLVGKKNIGIVARHVTHHALSQQVNLMINSPIVISEDLEILNNASVYFDSNLTKITISPNGKEIQTKFKYKLSDVYKFEKREDGLYNENGRKVLSAGDKLYVSLADIQDLDNNYISETLSAFVNAYVDVAKDPYVFDMNGVTSLANVYFMMIRSGASLKYITKFLNQPIIKEYLNAQNRNESAFAISNDLTLSKGALAMSVINKFANKNKGDYFHSSTEWYKLSYPQRLDVYKAMGEKWNENATLGSNFSETGKIDTDKASSFFDDYYSYVDKYKRRQENQAKSSLLYSLKEQTLKEEKLDKVGYSNFFQTNPKLKSLDAFIVIRMQNINSRRLDEMMYTNIEEIDDPSGKESYGIDQGVILNQFLEYQRLGRLLNQGMNATSADTHGVPKNMESLKVYINNSDEFIAEKHFRNLESIDDISVIKPYKKILRIAREVYKPLYLIESNPVISEKLEQIKSIVTTLKQNNEHERIKDIVNNEFINFILHSNFGPYDHIDSSYIYNALIRGDEHNGVKRYSILKDGARIPISLIQLMTYISTNNASDLVKLKIEIQNPSGVVIPLSNLKTIHQIKGNTFVNEIAANVSEESFSWDEFRTKTHKTDRNEKGKSTKSPAIAGKLNSVLALLTRAKTAQHQNSITKALDGLKQLSPDIYNDIIKIGIGQFGVGMTPGSYFTLIPANDYLKMSIPLVDFLSNMSHNDLLEYMKEFEKQFWHKNIDLLPNAPKRGSVSFETSLARYPAVKKYRFDKTKERYELQLVFADHINLDTMQNRYNTNPTNVIFSNIRPIIGNRKRFVGYMYNHNEKDKHITNLLQVYGTEQISSKAPELLLPHIEVDLTSPNYAAQFNETVLTNFNNERKTATISKFPIFPNMTEGDQIRITVKGQNYKITYLGEKNLLKATELLADAAERRKSADETLSSTGELSNFEIAIGDKNSDIRTFMDDLSTTRHLYEVEKLKNIHSIMSKLEPLMIKPKGWITGGSKFYTSEFMEGDIIDVTSDSAVEEAKQFSAMYARLADGRLIEEVYQMNIKGFGKAKQRPALYQGKPVNAFLFKNKETGEFDFQIGKNKPTNRKTHKFSKVDTASKATSLRKAFGDDLIWAFGANSLGIHGAGAAKAAKDFFGAKVGTAEGLQGNSYGIITKLKPTKESERSVTSEQIKNSIAEMYEFARQNPDRNIVISYSTQKDVNKVGLNGYTSAEMAEMFGQANGYLTTIPDNIIFEQNFLRLVNYNQYKGLFKQYLLKDHPNKYRTLVRLTDNKILRDKYSQDKDSNFTVNQARALYEIMEDQVQVTQQASQSDMFDFNEIVHTHGGAFGADILFEAGLKKHGVKSVGFSFNNHDYKGDRKNYKNVEKELSSPSDTASSKLAAEAAALFLGRPFNAYSKEQRVQYINKLIRRNYHQIKNADAVYAIGTIVPPAEFGRSNKKSKSYENTSGKDVVDGGTGWGVAMAIAQQKPVFVYNQADLAANNYPQGWYKWDNRSEKFVKIDDDLKIEYKKFAGIGSRDIKPSGEKAINDLIAKTFEKPSNFPGSLVNNQNQEIEEIITKWEEDSQKCN